MNKILSKSAYVVTAAIMAACSSQVSAAELVTNGGFETGNLSGWSQSGNTGFTGVTSIPHSGTYGAYFGPVGSIGTISQILTTVIGQSYDVSFWVQSDGGSPSFIGANWGGSSLLSLTNPSAFGYSQYSYNVMATSTSTVLSFDFRNDPGFHYLDDVSVVDAANGAVPEPATWAMMLLGFLAIGSAVRYGKARQAKVRFAF